MWGVSLLVHASALALCAEIMRLWCSWVFVGGLDQNMLLEAFCMSSLFR